MSAYRPGRKPDTGSDDGDEPREGKIGSSFIDDAKAQLERLGEGCVAGGAETGPLVLLGNLEAARRGECDAR